MTRPPRPPLLPVLLAGFTAFMGFYATQPLLPFYGRLFHASTFAVSLTVTAPSLAVALAAPLVGRLADTWGRRDVIVASGFLLAALAALTATATQLAEIVAWRFVQGLVTPGVIAVTLAYIHEEWPAGSVGRATAAYVSGTVFGGFIGRAIVGVLADRSHWWTGFVVIAAVSFVCAVVVLLTLPRDRQGRTRPPPGTAISLRAHATNRELLVTYAVGFCILFTQVAVFTYVTFPLSAPPFGLSSAELGWIFAVYLVGAVITPIAGRWIDRRGARVMIAAAMAIGTAGALLTLAHGLPIVIAGLALCCTSVFIAQSTASSHLGTAARDNRGLAIGLYASCYYLGGTAGSALPALFWNLGGWPACVALIVAVQVATAAIGVGFWEGRPASPYEEVEPVP